MKHSPGVCVGRACLKGWGSFLLASFCLLGGSLLHMDAADLVRPVIKPSKRPAPRESVAGQSRQVLVRTEVLGSETFELPLFDGESLRLERTSETQLPNGDRVWSGRIAGEPLSRATFAVRQGVLSGTVDRAMENGNELYEIAPFPGGYHLFRHDPTRLPASFSQTLPAPFQTGRQALPANDSAPATTPVMDLLVVYTPASAARYGKAGIESRILQAVADANAAFVNSAIDARFALVHMAEVDYVENGVMSSSLAAMQRPQDGVLDEVHTLREQHGADLVALISEDTNSCGMAYVMATPNPNFAANAFAVVYSACLSSLSLAHELGHILGCQHDRSSTLGVAAFPYAYGWRQCDVALPRFRTVMAEACAGAIRINYFSNPALTYEGLPLGVDGQLDPLNAADNARAINQTAPIVAAFRTLPPAAPTNLKAVAATSTRVEVQWADRSTNESGFLLERSLDGTLWHLLAQLPADTTGYTDTSVVSRTTYQYRISATNSGGTTPGETTASVTTPGAIPTAPSDLVVTQEGTSARLTWKDNAANETSIRIERSVNGGTWFFWISLAANTATWTDTQVVVDSTYAYRVSAANTEGRSPTTSAASITIVPLIPRAPSGLSATSINGTVVLSWIDNASNESTFRLERSVNGGNFLLWTVLPANTQTYTDPMVSIGFTYAYRVSAANTLGTSPSSAPASITVPGLPPAAPSGLTAVPVSRTQITLNWQDNSDNETGFTIERSTNGTTWSPIASVGANVRTFSNTGLRQAVLYSYRVRANNAWGSSAFSPVVSTRTTL
jgi:peptidyl-Asp metalloendopeptidase